MKAGGSTRLLVAMSVVAIASTVLGTAPGPAQAQTEAEAPEAVTTDWRAVEASGVGFTCGLRTGARLYCWGRDSQGYLGNGAPRQDRARPTAVVGGDGTGWASVSALYSHVCAITVGHRLFCWGQDYAGQLGNGGEDRDRARPVEVAGHTADWSAVSVGGYLTCARKVSGRLFCWGSDRYGQLGNGGLNLSSDTPVEVAGRTTSWTAVQVGLVHACARKASGRLYCWGFNASGPVGNGTFRNQSTPAEVAGHATDWASFATGYEHTCARKTNGRLFCWGRDRFGELGNGDTDNAPQATPSEVQPATSNWQWVEAAGSDTCARSTDRKIYCWGNTIDGELAQPSIDPGPTEVPGGISDWSTFNAGYTRCGRRSSGLLMCWGVDDFGQIGNGPPFQDEPVPVAVG